MSSVQHVAAGYYSENDTRYVFLDGLACAELKYCFSSLQSQLSLPDYFGHNLDALEEVLDDLDWIKEKAVKIIIANSHALLRNNMARRGHFLDILHKANHKIQIIYLEEQPAKE